MSENSDALPKNSALAAAVPLLVFGLGVMVMFLVAVPFERLVIGGGTPLGEIYRSLARFNSGLLAGGLMVAVLVAGGLVVVVRRLPSWGFTWIGVALAAVLVTLAVLGDEREHLISPLVDGLILAALLLAGLAALVVAILRSRRAAGLFSIGVSATLALALCFWVTAGPFLRFDLALLAGPAGLLLGLLTYAYARSSGAAAVAAFCGVGLLELGLFSMSAYVWWDWALDQGVGFAWILLGLLGLLLVGPLAGLLRQRLTGTFSRSGGTA